MKLTFGILPALVAISFVTYGQTSTGNGEWGTGSIWSGGASPGTGTTTLTVNQNTDITIASGDTVTLGSYSIDGSNDRRIFNNGSASNSLIVNGVMIIYSNSLTENEFSTSAMELVVNGTLIILGDLRLKNKMNIDNAGILVVSGVFDKDGGLGTYTDNGGKIYAGDYQGKAEDGGGYLDAAGTEGDSGDSKQLIGDLGGDGEFDIEKFINGGGEIGLPVTLTSFHAVESIPGEIMLNWSTASEWDFDHYDVQKAKADGQFKTIHQVDGKGAAAISASYQVIDNQPYAGINYYRLVAIDVDGSQEIFPLRKVFIEPQHIDLNAGPNPIFAGGTFKIANTYGEEVKVTLYDLMGQISFETTVSDYDFIKLPTSVASGRYILHVELNGIKHAQSLIIR